MLKKVCFYIDDLPEHELAGRVFMDLWMHRIEAERLPVSAAMQEKAPAEAAGDTSGTKKNEILIVTDLSGLASYYRKKGYAVLGYLHEKNKDAAFEGVSYLTEDFSGITAEYCRMVYDRAHGIARQILETERCIVREMSEQDLDRLYEIYENPEITAYMEPLYEDRQEELTYIRNYIERVYGFYGYGMWSIVEKESGELIGRAGIEQKEEYPELGYLIAADRQRRGYAKEVCTAILAYAQSELGMQEIYARVHCNNSASLNLCRALGFVPAGRCGCYELFSYRKG